MRPEILNNHTVALVAQTVFIMLFMLPDVSLILWKGLTKKWMLRQEKILLRRNKKIEGKLKKYWEIDMRKLK